MFILFTCLQLARLNLFVQLTFVIDCGVRASRRETPEKVSGVAMIQKDEDGRQVKRQFHCSGLKRVP